MADAVSLSMEPVGSDGGILRKVIDDSAWQRRAYDMRREFGNGMVRERGAAVACRTLSIPIEEFSALLMVDDPDAVAWWKDRNDRRALRRLVARFPHWRVSSASI